jgi:type IV secretion system protein TrbL
VKKQLILIAAAATLFMSFAAAQGTAPSQILEQYRSQRTVWFTAVWPFANTLFGLLAVIEFAWSAALMLLEKSDLQSWASALIRKIMWIGAFYALLIYGRYWIPAITDSFEIIGQQAAQTGPMSPTDIFIRGMDLAGALMAASSTAAFFTNLGTSLAMIVTGLITALAFIAITVQFVVAMVESYIIVAAGFVFVGFGGSRWTAPYVERYIGLGVSTGVKIMMLYLLIGTGMNLSVEWMTSAQQIADSASPAMSALEIMGASIIFMMLCWQIPKLFAAVLGGSPALTGGDLVSSGAFLAGGALAVGSTGIGTGAAASGLLLGNSLNGGSAGLAGSPGVGGSPPLLPTPDAGGGTAATPPPPSRPPETNSLGSRQPAAPGRSMAKFGAGFLRPQIPPDAGPHASPPRMNIDHND